MKPPWQGTQGPRFVGFLPRFLSPHVRLGLLEFNSKSIARASIACPSKLRKTHVQATLQASIKQASKLPARKQDAHTACLLLCLLVGLLHCLHVHRVSCLLACLLTRLLACLIAALLACCLAYCLASTCVLLASLQQASARYPASKQAKQQASKQCSKQAISLRLSPHIPISSRPSITEAQHHKYRKG